MNRDQVIVYISNISLFITLLLTLFLPHIFTKLIISLIIIPLTILTLIFIKKRSILSVYKGQILLIMSLISIIYIGGFYITGLYFGFRHAVLQFSFPVLYKFILPLIIIIVGIELLRNTYLAQKGIVHKIIFFVSSVMLDIAIYSDIGNIGTFQGWIDVFGNVIITSILFNLLFNYLSKHFGYYPNIVFRLVVTLYPYIFSIVPNMPDILIVFCKMLAPFIIYLIISSTYGRKEKVVSHRKSRIVSTVIAVVLILMLGSVMIVSNRFGIGMLVIGSESMSGTIEKGDIIFYKAEDNYSNIEVEDIIVFNNNGAKIVHRVVDIFIINGEMRYITKGDANESRDTGYITNSQIVGVVSSVKLEGLGWPTLLLREAFERK